MIFAPKKIVTDFDHELMGKLVTDYLSTFQWKVESAPPKHQHQHGLVERNWRTMIYMSCSWLTSSLIPSDFWFHVVKRACEISNYFPTKSRGQTTSLYEIVHHVKPDIRILFPLFSISYINKQEDSNTTWASVHTQSLRVIASGKSSKTNFLEFYHPPSK